MSIIAKKYNRLFIRNLIIVIFLAIIFSGVTSWGVRHYLPLRVDFNKADNVTIKESQVYIWDSSQRDIKKSKINNRNRKRNRTQQSVKSRN